MAARDHIAEYNRLYYRKNREERRAYAREYYRKNKYKILERRRQRYLVEPLDTTSEECCKVEKAKQYYKQYYEEHKTERRRLLQKILRTK